MKSQQRMVHHFRWSLLAALFGVLAVTRAAWTAEQPTYAVGVAKVDITPPFPVVLAGYGGRTSEYDAIESRLWARALVIGDSAPALVVAIDNCGAPEQVRDRLAKRLAIHGVAPDRLVVSATHTHNAPNLVGYAPILWKGRLTKGQAERMERYTEFALDRMAEAALRALKSRRPMTLAWAQGRASFGGNRRSLREGQWIGFGFQRSGPVDHSLPVLVARDAEDRIRAVWTNYACHCTTVGSRNVVDGDWAGYANAAIEAAFPDAVSLTTIGCGADVGPQPTGSIELAKQHGKTIADEVKSVVAARLIPLTKELSTTQRQVKLPLERPKSREYWEAQIKTGGFHGQLAQSMLKQLDTRGAIADEVAYPISVWRFGDQLAIVFLAGEVVVDYAVRLKSELDWERVWITAWSNAMPGYIPSRRVLAEGGYEADFSQVYYEQPGRYRSEVENIVVGGVRQLVGDAFETPSGLAPSPYHSIPSGEAEALKRFRAWLEDAKDGERGAIAERLRPLMKTIQTFDPKTAKGGEQTEWYDYAGDFSSRRFIRQMSDTASLRWRADVASDSGTSTWALCFRGGLGWRSQPATEGFVLTVNDASPIRFDVTRDPARWRSEDRRFELVYVPLWTSNEDSAGFFFLLGPRPADRSVSLTVRSAGRNSRRWFALDVVQPNEENDQLGKLRSFSEPEDE